MRPHGRARVDPHSPSAWSVCDRCNFLYNLIDLQWQYQFAGPKLQNIRLLVCRQCLDVPQPQLRTIILPPDPVPVLNPRPEQYTSDNNPLSSIAVNTGTLVQGGGLQSAFDSSANKPFYACAMVPISVAGYNNTIGKNWGTLGEDDDPITHVVSQYVMYAPNNGKFFGGGATGYKLQGSEDSIVWTNIDTGTTAGTVGETIDTTVTTGNSYQYHRVVFNGDGINSMAIAQLELSVSS